jgi:hypothetical protein
MSGREESYRKTENESVNTVFIHADAMFLFGKFREVESGLLFLNRAKTEMLHGRLAPGSGRRGSLGLLRPIRVTLTGGHVSIVNSTR